MKKYDKSALLQISAWETLTCWLPKGETGPETGPARKSSFSKWIISEILKLWDSKSSKFYLNSRNAIRYRQKVFGSSDKCIWVSSNKFPVRWGGYLASIVTGLRNTPKSSDLTKGGWFPALPMSVWWKSSMKGLFCRLLQCLGLVNKLTAKGCSETGHSMYSCNHVFPSE